MDRVYHVGRGYKGIVEKRRAVDADIERLQTPAA